MVEKSFERELLEQRAIARVQAMALRLLEAKKISRSELADRMGVSVARVSQILSGDPENISVRRAVALFDALDERLVMTCEGIERLDRQARERCAAMTGVKDRWRFANGNESVLSEEREAAVA